MLSSILTNANILFSKIFPQQDAESFHAEVRKLLLSELEGLDPSALLVMRSLIRRGLHEKNDPDAVNLRESYGMLLIITWSRNENSPTHFHSAQAERFASGIPHGRFFKIANKEIKHKL